MSRCYSTLSLDTLHPDRTRRYRIFATTIPFLAIPQCVIVMILHYARPRLSASPRLSFPNGFHLVIMIPGNDGGH